MPKSVHRSKDGSRRRLDRLQISLHQELAEGDEGCHDWLANRMPTDHLDTVQSGDPTEIQHHWVDRQPPNRTQIGKQLDQAKYNVDP